MGGAWIAGVDGCRAGWIVARHPIAAPPTIEITMLACFAALLDPADPPAVLAVDMPIGLPARSGPGGRGPERAIRPLLGKRRSSVFSIPSRAAIEANGYAAARLTALTTSDPPRSVAKQAFNIFPKIREVDAGLRGPSGGIDPPWPARVFEVHPELAFATINGGRPLRHAKKARKDGRWVGADERRRILLGAGLPAHVVLGEPPKGAALDDMLDALALLLVARRILRGVARPFPDPPGRDGFGLPIAIWA